MSERILIENIGLYQPGSKENRLGESDILIDGNTISKIGKGLRDQAEVVDYYIDGTGKIGLPGFINTHDHPSQTFMRDVPQMQNQKIDRWIAEVCKLTLSMDPEAHYHAAKIKALELLLSGTTTTANMVYLFPQIYDDLEIADAVIQGVSDVGMRQVFYRGSMSRSQKDGALFPDNMVESSDEIVERTRDVIDRYHQQGTNAMVKVGVAPCTIFTSTSYDFENAASISARYGVCMQTHLSESAYEHEYIRDNTVSLTPLEFVHELGWDSTMASFAHCIEVTVNDIARLARHHNSVCHCPISNSRSPKKQSGIAPISEMLDLGVNVSLGVDGAAGNNSGNMLEEMKWARTISGARVSSTYLPVHKVFDMATFNGARTLNWSNLGRIDEGYSADMTIFDIQDSMAHFGTWDQLSALISCQAIGAETVIVNGKIVVTDGHHTFIDHSKVLEEAWKKWREVFNK